MWGRVKMRGRIDSNDDYFIAPIVVAYKSLASCNEGSFSLVSLLKSLLTYKVATDYQQRSWGRLCVVTKQSVKPAMRHARVYFWTTDTNALTISWYSYTTANRGNREFQEATEKEFDCGSVCVCNRCMRKICIYLTHDKLKEKHSRWYFYWMRFCICGRCLP